MICCRTETALFRSGGLSIPILCRKISLEIEVTRYWCPSKAKEKTVDRLKTMDDIQLRRELRRLERDAEDFRLRAATVAAGLERNGGCVISDPLHQRLASIHAFLRDQLTRAAKEVERRDAAFAARPGWSLQPLMRALPFASGS
jgi:hypothetical protein